MSATGYTPIQLYYSTTASAVPVNTNLANGELAINITDGKLYYKDNGGTVRLLASNAGSTPVTSFQTSLSGLTPNTSTTGAITLAGTLGVPSGGTGLTTLTAGYIPYGNGTSALSSSSTLNYSGSLLSSTAYTASGTITGSSNVGVYAYGTLGYSDVNHILTMASSQNGYIQMEIQNTNTGSSASSDVVVGNNNTTASTYYGDFGMNSSGWAGTAGTNSFGAPNMVYLTATTSDLLLGTTTANAIRFAVGGGADAMKIDGTTSIVSFPTTGAITLPNGTTGQQPTGVAGMLRFNSTTTQFEGYNGTSWASVGGAAISNDTSTSSFEYPLFASATSGTALTIYTSNAKYLYKPSTGELQAYELNATNGLLLNNATVSASYSIASGTNAFSVGPITVATGQSVTVASGQRWLVL
jgi:hypothetical protein